MPLASKAPQHLADVLHIEVNICSLCGKQTMCYLAVAVGLNENTRVCLCGTCMDRVLKRQELLGTRRVLAMGAGMVTMMQVMMEGQTPDLVPATLPAGKASGLVAELFAIVDADPHKGTQDETAFFHGTRERTKQIGHELYTIGGHPLMVAAYNEVRAAYGHSARSLEVAWHGVGEWFD